MGIYFYCKLLEANRLLESEYRECITHDKNEVRWFKIFQSGLIFISLFHIMITSRKQGRMKRKKKLFKQSKLIYLK